MSCSAFLLVLMTLTIYSVLAFPNLPRPFGGGRKPIVTLFLARAFPGARALGEIPISADGMTVGPALCVLDTQKEILITPEEDITKHSVAIAISKDFVAAVVFEALKKTALAASPPHR